MPACWNPGGRGVIPLYKVFVSSEGAAKLGVGCNAAVVTAGLASELGVVSGNESTGSLASNGKPFWANGNPVASFTERLVVEVVMPAVNFTEESWLN